MWQKQQKIKHWDADVRRLKSDQFVLVKTPCTVPLCLENASKIFFQLKVWATTWQRKSTVIFFRFMDQIRGLIQVFWALQQSNLSKQSRPVIHISVKAKSHIAVGKTWQAQGKPRLPAIQKKINTSSFPDKNCLSNKWNGSSVAKPAKLLSLHKVPLYCVVPCPHFGQCLNDPTHLCTELF